MSILSHAITGESKIVALLGDPVAHSLSPAIHNHIYATLNLPYVYIPLNVSAADVRSVVKTLRRVNFCGANVTIPHKQAVVYLCDTISPLSKIIGAVNTLYMSNGKLHGTTTDAEGFFAALAADGVTPADKNIVILGNGGTARTLCSAMALRKDAASITLVGRNSDKINNLALEINNATGATIKTSSFSDDALASVCKDCTLLLNCTNVGMHPDLSQSPLDNSFFHPTMYVFDTIYNPHETLFLSRARAAGCKTQNGLRMLLLQALASHTYFTNTVVDPSIIDLTELSALIGK